MRQEKRWRTGFGGRASSGKAQNLRLARTYAGGQREWLAGAPRKKKGFHAGSPYCIWLRGKDLNLRPSGYEPDELPDCSTPRQFPEPKFEKPGV